MTARNDVFGLIQEYKTPFPRFQIMDSKGIKNRGDEWLLDLGTPEEEMSRNVIADNGLNLAMEIIGLKYIKIK